MRWRVKSLTVADNAVAVISVDAADEAALQARLAAEGRVALSIAPERTGVGSFSFRPSAPRVDVALFCEELKALLDAGLNLIEALDTLTAANVGQVSGEFLHRLLETVRRGKRFSDALENEPQVPRVLVAVIRGAEFTSGVAHALGRYLDYERRIDELKGKAVSAAIYPGIVLSLGVVIVLFLLGYVVPRFAAIYADHASALSGASSLVLWLGGAVNKYYPWIGIALAVVIVWAVMTLRAVRARGLSADALARMPIFNRVIRDLENARVFETLSMLLGGGFTLPHALRVAGSAALTSTVRAALHEVCEDIERGAALSGSLRQRGLGDEVAARLAGAGENSGDLSKALGHAGAHYSRHFSRRVERLTRVVEPVLLILVGATIGTIVLLMYMPIFDLAGGIR